MTVEGLGTSTNDDDVNTRNIDFLSIFKVLTVIMKWSHTDENTFYRESAPHVSEGSAASLLCANVYESMENEMGNTLIC